MAAVAGEMTPKRLDYLEKWLADGGLLTHEEQRDLIAALRASWARAEAAEASEDALRAALETQEEVCCHNPACDQCAPVHQALARLRTAHAEVAARRREVAEAAMDDVDRNWPLSTPLFEAVAALQQAMAKAESAQP